jgi:pimeloyl-ACP methyl ester carboxylesterase
MSDNKSTAQEIDIPLSHYNIKAKAWGNPENPAILALHGWLDNAASFDLLAPHFVDDFYFVAIDQVGHGHSGHRPIGAHYNLWDGVEDIECIVEYFGWAQVDILGHSMGGVISVLYAGSFPERVRKLGLIEALGPMANIADIAPQNLAESIKNRLSKRNQVAPIYPSLKPIILARTKAIGGLSIEAATTLINRATKKVEGGYVWRTDPRLRYPSAVRFTEEQVQAFIAGIMAKCCLVIGDKGFYTEKTLGPRLKQLKHKTVIELPGIHHLHLDGNADGVANVMLGFFKD